MTALLICASLFFALGVFASRSEKSDNADETFFVESEIDVKEKGESEIRAVWVASVFNLDYPSESGLSEESLKKEADTLVRNTVSEGYNTIFFQVRPSSDALYRSEIFPSSHFLCKKQGDPLSFDALRCMSELCDEHGLFLYAWINPYRVCTASMRIEDLAENNPAILYPELVYECGGGYYYDPGEPRVTELIVNGVAEICKGYNIDGIVFDDYFYAEGIEEQDLETYLEYSGGEDLYSFRRSSVENMIESCYREIKSISRDISLCVSVRGIWQNIGEHPLGSNTSGSGGYSSVFCDALALVEKEIVDYISPQLYWSFENSVAPFATLADWWAKAVSERSDRVGLTVSLAPYYLGGEEIDAQIEYVKKAECYKGYALYSASCLELLLVSRYPLQLFREEYQAFRGA